MSDVFIGIGMLVALFAAIVLIDMARKAGAIPNQQKIDRADGTMPGFIDSGSSNSKSSSGADAGSGSGGDGGSGGPD